MEIFGFNPFVPYCDSSKWYQVRVDTQYKAITLTICLIIIIKQTIYKNDCGYFYATIKWV